jgi:sphingomyelin phosphodiesterase 2
MYILIQFHAPYGKGEDTYKCHRIAQAWQIAKLLRGAVERGRFVIAVRPHNPKEVTVGR